MTTLEDQIHQLLTSPRPKSDEQVATYKALVEETLRACQTNAGWKRFVSSLIHKRYHLLAPELKNIQSEKGDKPETAGDGERKQFYLALEKMVELLISDPASEQATSVKKAIQVLFQLAPFVGGSRDVCHLIEQSIDTISSRGIDIQAEKEQSLSLSVSNVIRRTLENEKSTGLSILLDFCAQQLDKDLALVRKAVEQAAEDGDVQMKEEDEKKHELPSTLNVFLPHNQRGRLSSAQKQRLGVKHTRRQVINTAAELLIWSRSTEAMGIKAFADNWDRVLLASHSSQSNKPQELKRALQTMQTIIRKLRQELNTHARDQGYMLVDQFLMDSTRLSVVTINKGKQGDVAKLLKFAKKAGDQRVLSLIQLRFASNPSKITPFGSLAELDRAKLRSMPNDEDDEIVALEKEIYNKRIKATLQRVRDAVKRQERGVVIASIDISPLNHIGALFFAAALCSWDLIEGGDGDASTNVDGPPVKLILGTLVQELNCYDDFRRALDGITSREVKFDIDAETFVSGDGVATTKALCNLLDRHVRPESEDLFLLTPAQVCLPKERKEKLTELGCRVHCHNADDLGARLQREGAKAGDVTISLAWDSFDDLDLHVILPTGEEIYYSNKQASKGGIASLDVDMNAGGRHSEEPVENVFIGDLEKRIPASSGKYRVFVRNYAYHTSDRSASIPWRVNVAMNGKNQSYSGECKGSGSSSDVTVCEFEYSGRTIPFPGEEDLEQAFGSSSVVNLTASTGQTLESLIQLAKVREDLERVEQVQMLVDDEEKTDDVRGNEETPAPSSSTQRRTLEVTSKDRLDILLAKLPASFHRAVAEAFGGLSLVDECAAETARRMMEEKLPMSALKAAGYPQAMVDLVKSKLPMAAVQ